jgi:hypothetical protein
MQQRFVPAVLLALAQAALSAGSLRAQPMAVPADGRTCFCLQDHGGQTLAGCVGEKGPNDFYATATCWDEQRRTRTREVTVGRSWTVVPDGLGFCSPCDRRPLVTPGDDSRGFQPLPGDPTTLPPGPPRPIPLPGQGR